MDPFKNIVDAATDYLDEEEEFYEERLARYDDDRERWATAIDRAAYDVVDNIAIGSTGSQDDLGGTIGTHDFPTAAGPYYVDGLEALVNDTNRIEELLTEYGAEEVGRLVLEITKLRRKLERETEEDLDPETVSQALEALIEKLTTKGVESDAFRRPLRETNSVADMLLQLFDDPTASEYADVLLQMTSQAAGAGDILSLVDEPQLTTPLWDHQRDGLRKWVANDRRGYVNMATATGKTVLGLATIAQQFDGLHPSDVSPDLTPDSPRDLDGDFSVLIVAGRNLLLDQWRDEFEAHLNVPKHRLETHETDTGYEIRLSWGTIEFQTSQQLANNDVIPEYDLVILDEAHRYTKGSSTSRGWRDVFETLTTQSDDILAMSGSIDAGWIGDETVEGVLDEALDEVETFSLTEAKRRGVVADFDWHISYSPVGDDTQQNLIEVTETCARYVDNEGMLDLSSFGGTAADADVRTLQDLRSFANTTAGRELREQDDEFDALANAAFSRSTRRWQLEPTVDTIVDILREHEGEKAVVLVQSYPSAATVEEEMEDIGFDDSVAAVTDRSEDPSSAIQEFNNDEVDVVVGPGELLGTGIDLPDAELAINVGKGGVNTSLVQRIGRVLRNPSGEKDATFYHLVSIPTDRRAIHFHEDGRRLLEHIVSFSSLGERMEERPFFECRDTRLEDIVAELERCGAASYRELSASLEEFGERPEDQERLRSLCERITTATHERIVSFEAMGRSESADDAETENSEMGREPVSRSTDTTEESTIVDEPDLDRDDPATTRTETETDADVAPELIDVPDLTETQVQYVIDVAEREPIADDELIDYWDLESRRELAEIVVKDAESYLTRNDDGDVCTTEKGARLYDESLGGTRTEASDVGVDEGDTSTTSDGSKLDGSVADSTAESEPETDVETETTDPDGEVDGVIHTLSDHSDRLVERTAEEFDLDPRATAHLLDLYAESEPIPAKELVDGWGFDSAGDVYKYVNSMGIAGITGMGHVKIDDGTRERIDDVQGQIDEGDAKNRGNSDSEMGGTETETADTGRGAERDPTAESSGTSERVAEAEDGPSEYYSRHLKTGRESLIEELQRIGDHALYPPTEGEVVSEARCPFGSFVYEFGSYTDALAAAGYKVDDREVVDSPVDEYSPSDVVATVQIVADLLERAPVESTVVQSTSLTSDSVSPLGKWIQVLAESGVDTDSLPDDTSPLSRDEIETDIEAVSGDLGRAPIPAELEARSDIRFEHVVEAFGSWQRALAACVPNRDRPTVSRDDLKGCSEATTRLYDFAVERVGDAEPDYALLFGLVDATTVPKVLDSRETATQPTLEDPDDETEAGAGPTEPGPDQEGGSTVEATDDGETTDPVSTTESESDTLDTRGVDPTDSDEAEVETVDDSSATGSEAGTVADTGTEDDPETDPDDVTSGSAESAAQEPVVVEDRLRPEFELDEVDELKDDLYRLHTEFGHPPRPSEVEHYGRFSPRAYVSEFGPWGNALEAVGYDLDDAWVDVDDYDDDLLTALSNLADHLGHRPTTRNIDELTDYSATSYVSRWGSIHAAIEAASGDADPSVKIGTSVADIVEAGAESWDSVHDFDYETRRRASREALLLLKRGWTGTDHAMISKVETRVDVEDPSFQSMWHETLRPVLQAAESRGVVEENGETWQWTGVDET